MKRLLQLRHYSPRTQRSYLGWADRFLRYLGGGRLEPPTPAGVKPYLSYLASHRHVLGIELGDMAATVRAKRGQSFPVVLSVDEVRAVLTQLTGKCQLMLALLYGGGLRWASLCTSGSRTLTWMPAQLPYDPARETRTE